MGVRVGVSKIIYFKIQHKEVEACFHNGTSVCVFVSVSVGVIVGV